MRRARGRLPGAAQQLVYKSTLRRQLIRSRRRLVRRSSDVQWHIVVHVLGRDMQGITRRLSRHTILLNFNAISLPRWFVPIAAMALQSNC